MQKRIIKLTFPKIPTAKKRVAAYARVSSGKDAMLHSLSAQVSYYSSLIQSHNDWKYVGVYADEIKEKFIIAYNQLLGNRKELLEACEVMCETASDCSDLNKEIDALNDEIQLIAEMVNQCVKENAGSKQSQSSYDKKYNSLVRRYEKADKRLTEVTQERDARINRERELRIFISELAEKPLVIEEWDEELWVSILETATVHKDRKITFLFKNGTSIEVGAE